MFENFTESALNVIITAQTEAKNLKHNKIGTEHILLGLLNNNTESSNILHEMGISFEKFRNDIELINTSNVVNITDEIPFTNFVKELIQNASITAKKYKQPVTDLHLLLALTLTNGIHMQILKNNDVDIKKINDYVDAKIRNLDIKLTTNKYSTICYIFLVISLLLFSTFTLNNVISAVKLSYNTLISMFVIICIAIIIRNYLIFHFGVGQISLKLIQFIRLICFVIAILFTGIVIFALITYFIITISKRKYIG